MDNPYSAPLSNIRGEDSLGFEVGVTRGVVAQLAQTKGWVRLIAVLGIIGACIMFLTGLLAFFAGGAIGQSALKSQNKMAAGSIFAGVGMIYSFVGLMIFYPAFKLNKFASAIGRLIYSGKGSDLEDAIEQQRAYWKYVGVMLALVLIIFAATIVAGIAGIAAMRNL